MEALKFEVSSKLKKAVGNIQIEISNRIASINAGGCGVFALAMHQELKKYGINSRIAIIDNPMEERWVYENKKATLNNIANKAYVDEDDTRNTSFVHYCLILDNGVSFDGLNWQVLESWREDGYTYVGDYSEFEMQLALKYGGWNCAYDTSHNVLVQSLIKENLNKYLN